MNPDDVAELKGVVEKWLEVKHIPHNGLLITVTVVPLEIILNTNKTPRGGRTFLQKLSEKDWGIILGLPWKVETKKTLELLKQRENAGIYQNDFPFHKFLPSFVETHFNALFRVHKVLYRLSCKHFSEAHPQSGPYQIAVISY